ncbi:TrkH family potassium uptake protein [Candidatus Margulisiibacteriota bacterium]
MNFAFIFKIISILILIIAVFMLAPLWLAFYFGEQFVLKPLALTLIGTVITSLLILFLSRKNKNHKLSTRDAMFLVTFSWITVSFVSSLPLVFSGAIPSFTDAFFEMMSGYTTTGASILNNIQALPKSLLFWRSLTHWLGGMGIIVLAVAILPLLGVGGLQLIKAEAPGPSVDKITPRIAKTAKVLWVIYVGFTVLETILLKLGGMSLFDSLTHTFGTLATGGFSPKNLSVGHYNSTYIDSVITLFMILAGINFVLHFRLLTGKIKTFLSDIELKVYLAIFFAATFLISITLYLNRTYQSLADSFRFASFQAASILTTTGYTTTNYESWPFFAQVLLFGLMFVGACSGSTGGGIKVIRIVLLFKQGLNEMKYLLHPRGIFSLKIGSKTIKKDIVYAVLGFFFLYMLMIVITTLVVASAGNSILTSASTALATLGNIGPGFSKIGPVSNYSFYPGYVKWFLSLIMLIGRLEIYTVLCLFTPIFWKDS